MKLGISRKLALGNIKKNYRFFVPRILSEAGLCACFYIIFTLACDSRLAKIPGGSYVPSLMLMGVFIIGILSAILIFYTNSFLMKQRKREFGLYSVLGMEKKHICSVLFCESFVCSIISIATGILAGIVFYKLASVLICNLLKAEIVAGLYYITPKTLIPAAAFFLGIDALAYAVNCIGIGILKPVELMKSANKGEKEPKIKWPLLIIGVLSLCGGYYISITTKTPLEALLLFFTAVLLVMLGTYLVFTSGSIFVLKSLKKKEKYYYKPGHITAVSGLIYRMKQNAVGLASIAILSTGVLIMISSALCLYSRTETTLATHYPQDYYFQTVYYDENGIMQRIPEEYIESSLLASESETGLKIKERLSQEYFNVGFTYENGVFISDRASVSAENADDAFSNICEVIFITEENYIKLGGSPIGLKKGEVAIAPLSVASKFHDDSFKMFGREYKAACQTAFFPISNHLVSVNNYGMVVSDKEEFDTIFALQREAYGENASALQCRECITFENKAEARERGNEFSEKTESLFAEYIKSQGIKSYYYAESDSFWEAAESLYGMFGTLLFLGSLLGLVFLFATALIIYYKQISEGYEDKTRYQIMRKIGMTDKEVRGSIRSQIMMVFFLPLAAAGVHTAFAYPILSKILEILLLDDIWLFARWCIIVYIVFALAYAIIYKLTAKTYYKIVN